ncbi:hypothetical protein [Streptomyces luteogriseus]|nr:hypothetical protein [Streptomyces luteogriseus]WTJ28300.1 hypothetical protein OID52_15080 [Streptomyces luteogriseus]
MTWVTWACVQIFCTRFEAVEQLAELRARVAVLEAGNDEPGH